MKIRYVAALLLLTFAGAALAADKPTGPFANLKFRNLGPAVSGGRVSVVLGVPGKPDVYYVGTAGAGVWKTTDDGIKWDNVFKNEDAASIGAVALAPSNSKDIWVGTGEANARNDVLLGRGVYFSPDDGKTWQFKGLADSGAISKIVVNPTDPDTVYVAVQGNPWKPGETRGVFMTTDAGKTWKKVLYVNDTTGASDIEMDPSNPKVLLAGMWTVQRRPWTLVNGSTDGGIFRSEDGGKTWNKLTNGLPTSDPTDRINIAFAPSAPKTVYATMPTQKCILWGSTDSGDHWNCISNNHELAVRMFYFSSMAVAPDNPKTLYFSSFQLMKSTDGGKTAKAIDRGVHVDHHSIWIDPKNPKRIIQGNDGGAFESVDGGKSWRSFNNMPIEEFYTVAISNTVPFGVCGGIQDDNAACGPSNSLSRDGIWGADWWNPSGGDGTYVVPAPSDPSIVYAASQTGFTSRIDTRNMTRKFIRPVMTSMGDTPISKLQYRFNWAAPIAVSATDPNTLYIGANVVFKSTDGGANWQAISKDLTRNIKEHQPIAGGPVFHDISSAENTDTIISISLAPTDANVIWVGTDDGLVWVSKDGGANWTNVSTGLPQAVSLGRIYQIGVSPFDAGTAYIAVDGHMLGDEHPYVLKTTDYGAHWQSIANGLPDNYSAVVVREDPNRKGLLALGTMRGLYLSFDDGAHWQPMTGNLPTMAVWDIKFTKSPHDLVMATHGRGLWILDNIEALEQWQPKLADDSFHLFPSAQGTEWIEFGGRHIGPAPGDFKTPNPPSGPTIVYSLAKAMDVPKACAKKEDKQKNGDDAAQKAAQPQQRGDTQKKGAKKPAKEKKHKPSFEQCNPVVITVTDSAGKPVATFHAPGKAGINVASWNMRYTGVEMPKALRAEERPDENDAPKGPLALPGSYQVKVQAGRHDATGTVQVVSDPRVNPPMDVQRAAFDTAMRLRGEAAADVAMIGRTYDMMQALDKVLDSTKDAAAGSAKANVHASAQALQQQLGNFAKDVYDPSIQYKVPEDDLHQLSPYAMTFFGVYRSASYMGPDQAPNASQQQYIAQQEAGLQPMLDTFNGSLRQAVLDFNRQAKSAGVQTLPEGDPIKIGDPKLLAPAE